MVYKSSGLLVLLPISFRMETHLDLVTWTLVEMGSLFESPNKWYQSRWCVRLGNRGVAWWIPWTSFVKWYASVDRSVLRVLQRGSIVWISSWWWLGKGFRLRGSLCVDVVWKRLMCEGEIVGNITTWVKKSHIESLKKKVMVYKSSGLLHLWSISFRIEPHLGLLPGTLVEVGSFLGSLQYVVSEIWFRMSSIMKVDI